MINQRETRSTCPHRTENCDEEHQLATPTPPPPPGLPLPPPGLPLPLPEQPPTPLPSLPLPPVPEQPTPHPCLPSPRSQPSVTGRVPSTDVKSHYADIQRREVHTGIHKLLKWGVCKLDDNESIWLASNRHTVPILQQGPECGIAALCIALNMLEPSSCTKVNKSHISTTAKEKGFTLQGEMFSATNMLELARHVAKVSGKVVSGTMVENHHGIIGHLANGWPVLVPYDKDGNCEPCCKRGHKAHWAVLTGFVLQANQHSMSDLHSTSWQHDSDKPNLYHMATPNGPTTSSQAIRSVLDNISISNIYVLARQGKSTHVHPWEYSALSDSNANLVELGSNITDEIGSFVIPEGGIQAGLCNQVVLIRP
ncbi:UPF0692 protein C19orf54 homolog [Asterias rubens]|uniref:UPF0692 protein C19orf54 homolog n=1 Tax=Asterias rubens TaxID=7604 RepID=UPI00145516C1|nr:UPF0692 protein C19orf54 homolog [Asterias rubens]